VSCVNTLKIVSRQYRGGGYPAVCGSTVLLDPY